jgi:acyl carrier protein
MGTIDNSGLTGLTGMKVTGMGLTGIMELTGIFQDVLQDDALVLTRATAREDLPGWDSMNHLNILMALEMRYGIKFSLIEIEAVQGVGDLLDAVRGKLSAA